MLKLNIIFSIKHFLKAQYINGHRIHSPFAFDFVQNAVYKKIDAADYSLADAVYKEMINSDISLSFSDFGAKKCKIINSSARNIARKCSSKGRYGKLIFRTAKLLNPDCILELGTSLGTGTAYLKSACPNAHIITVDAVKPVMDIAEANFEKFGLNNITTVCDNFDNVLDNLLSNHKIQLIFIDGNHTKAATLSYFNTIKKYADNNTCIIFHDIDYSREMSAAWNIIQNDVDVFVAFETRKVGFVFFNNKLTKKRYCVRF